MHDVSRITSQETKKRYCLVSVSSPKFLLGSLVLFQTFMANNAWYKGDFYLIHNGELDSHHDLISAFHPGIQLKKISPPLKNGLHTFLETHPEYASRVRRFYLLELFHLSAYDKVLFLDSDILVRSNLSELFTRSQSLLACGDMQDYQSQQRLESAQNGSFNSGVLLLSHQQLGEDTFSDLLHLLHQIDWSKNTQKLTDQFLLNQYFSQQWQRLEPEYNYLLINRPEFYRLTKSNMAKARIWHFNGSNKPWDGLRSLYAIQQDPGLLMPFGEWQAAYQTLVGSLCFKPPN